MRSKLAHVGDRMLAAVLPRSTAAGCQEQGTYYECVYPHSCNDNHELSYVECVVNCAGQTNCYTIRCC